MFFDEKLSFEMLLISSKNNSIFFRKNLSPYPFFMKFHKILFIVASFIVSVNIVTANIILDYKTEKTPTYYYSIQYGYSGNAEDIKKWTTDNNYFLTLNLENYSDEKLYKQYLLNYKLEWEIRRMLSFLENVQIDKVQEYFEDNMLKTVNILHKSEKWYLPNEDQFIDYFIQKKSEILEYVYLDKLRISRDLGYPINKKSWNFLKNKWEEPFYMLGREPYDIYLENRKFWDYLYDYKSYFIFGFLIFVGILWGILFKIFHKIHHRKKSLEKSDEKEENSNKKIDSWSELSKGDKVALYILALIIPPLFIWLLSIPFFEEPIIIRNPWVDSVLFFWLIKFYFTRKYNHIITTWLIMVIIWHVFINILLTSQV